MRFGVMMAAAAALLSAASAQATSYIVLPKLPTITFAQTVTCPQSSTNCTISDPGTISPREFTIDVPSATGTFNFTGGVGSTSSAGVFNYDATFVFRGGSLISDVVTFNFISARFNGPTFSETTIRGFYENASLLDTSNGNIVMPVPEPATWALMILGMGAVGFAMRRRQRPGLSVA